MLSSSLSKWAKVALPRGGNERREGRKNGRMTWGYYQKREGKIGDKVREEEKGRRKERVRKKEKGKKIRKE